MTLSIRNPISMAQMLLFIMLCLCYSWVSPFFLYHNDIGWHLATGDWIREHGRIPATDPWSTMSQGAPWYNMAWLWDVLASLVFSVAGTTGLLALTVLIGAATIVLFAKLALALGSRADITFATALFVGLIFPFYAPPDIFLCVAPQQASLLLTAIVLERLNAFQHRQTPIAYITLGLLFALWCNVHGGFMLGHAMIAILLLAHLLRLNFTQCRAHGLLLLACLLAVLMNPYGLHIIDAVRGTLGHAYQHNVSEWKPLYKPDISLIFLAPSLFYCAVFAMSLLAWRKVRITSLYALCLLVLSCLLLVKGIGALRYFSFFLLTSIPVVALGITSMRKPDSASEPAWPLPIPTCVLVALGCAYILNMQNPHPYDMPDIRDPKPEIAFIEQHYPNARLLNHWNYGSFLIYETRGRLQPFIDGRMGTAYPDSVFQELTQLYDSKNWQVILDKHHINVALWPIIDKDMLQWFDHHPEWKKAYQGKLAVVMVKQQP